MEERKKIAARLAVSVEAFLTKVAEEYAMEADPGEMLNDNDYDCISRKVISDLAVVNRAKLHAEICLAEISEQAGKIAESYIQTKIRKVTRQRLP